MKRGKIIVYSGPSGVGKGTIKEKIFSNNKFNLIFSVSATSRKKREGEIEGKDYFFLSEKEFKDKIKEGYFLEWATFANNYYGTPLNFINKKLDEGYNIFLEIELDGAKQIISKIPDALTIFISPPSIEELRSRLLKRGTEEVETINKRIEIAKNELEEKEIFKYNIINDNINDTYENIKEILIKELNY